MQKVREVFFIAIVIVCFFAGIFFGSYKGERIQSPIIWQIGCFLVAVLAVWGLKREGKKDLREANSKYLEYLVQLANFKEKAEMIVPEYDACEFRNGTYFHEVEDKDLSWMATGSSIMLRKEVTKTEKVIQSSLLYHHKEGGTNKKYASQTFPFDKVALQLYVMKGGIKLYIDRFDRSQYFFDLDEKKMRS